MSNALTQLVAPANLVCKGYQQLTDMVAATALTVPKGASIALIQAEGDAFRWRDDGTAPTTTVGMILPEHDAAVLAVMPQLFMGNIDALQFIELGTSAVLNVTYYAQVP